MKIFKSGEVIRAVDINANFSKAIKTDLSNCPLIPCNKGGTGRTDCTIAYADKAGIAEIAEVAKTAQELVGGRRSSKCKFNSKISLKNWMMIYT